MTVNLNMLSDKNITIIGGCGHVGLPLGVKFALAGAKTYLLDINKAAVDKVNSGEFPFMESGGDEELALALKDKLCTATTDSTCLKESDVVIFVTGTPVDEHLNPCVAEVIKAFQEYEAHFKKDALVIMRSTLFPGTMKHLYDYKCNSSRADIQLAFCPERVAEGKALEEIESLPQIVSSFEDESFNSAQEIFSAIAPSTIKLEPLEAELAKLMANSWRYLEFAIANQFYMIAESQGVDFYKVFDAIRFKYPRASGYKKPGFAAGPCLFKDTMQLASFFNNQFFMGHSAMLVNEGLASFAVSKAKEQMGGSLLGKKVGILGLAFKADNDDIRESLSFKVIKGLEFEGAEILCHDPFVKELDFSNRIKLNRLDSSKEILESSDVVILCTPHSEYKVLESSLTSNKNNLVDVWGFYPREDLEVSLNESNELLTKKTVNA